MARLGLSQEMKLTQRLSPLQMQTIKFVEKPAVELEAQIRREYEDNPVLDEDAVRESREEEKKDLTLEEVREDETIPGYRLRQPLRGRDSEPQRERFSVKENLTQRLLEQLGYRELTEHERQVAIYLIGSLDPDGYLRRDLLQVVDDMAFRSGIRTDEEEALRMLRIIQQFEPSGVGARDTRECLMLQLQAEPQTEDVRVALRILEECFQDLSGKHYDKILRRLDIDEGAFRRARACILKLNPHPGGNIDDDYSDQADQVVPDFLLSYENGRFDLEVTRVHVPELRLKANYARILQDGPGENDPARRELYEFVRSKYQSMKNALEAVRQRHNTLEKTMQAILEYQNAYFEDGDESKLRPMVLKDIAARTGFDISTISRVANSKYIQTHFGIYPLKYFFSEGMTNLSGEEVSTREIKKVLSALVDGEDKRHPLTDEALVEELSKRGYKVARRTVAKYRDQLAIPNAALRRDI